MIWRALSLVAMSLLPLAAQACEGEEKCHIGDRSYHVVPPDGWDGMTPLPVQVHFHGWARQGIVPVRSPRTGRAARAAGVLFVAPDGLDRTWRFRRANSPDTDFVLDVLAQVRARYPTDGRLIVSGYSWGALMAARFACESGEDIHALLLISGAFGPEIACEADRWPERVSHVHGTTDGVLRFPIGPDGSDSYAVALWRAKMGCPVDPVESYTWSAVEWLTHQRREWACETGRVTLDIHSASHLIPRGWVARHLGEILTPDRAGNTPQ